MQSTCCKCYSWNIFGRFWYETFEGWYKRWQTRLAAAWSYDASLRTTYAQQAWPQWFPIASRQVSMTYKSTQTLYNSECKIVDRWYMNMYVYVSRFSIYMYMTYVEQSWIFAASHNRILEAPAVTLVSDALPLGQVARGILKLKGSWEVHVFNVPIPQTSEMCLFLEQHESVDCRLCSGSTVVLVTPQNTDRRWIISNKHLNCHLFLPNCPVTTCPGGYRQP